MGRGKLNIRVAVPAVFKILQKLRNTEPISFFLRLYRNDEVFSLSIGSYIELVDFDLANALNFCPQMILQQA